MELLISGAKQLRFVHVHLIRQWCRGVSTTCLRVRKCEVVSEERGAKEMKEIRRSVMLQMVVQKPFLDSESTPSFYRALLIPGLSEKHLVQGTYSLYSRVDRKRG